MMLKIPAGSELNKLVAVVVMEYTVYHYDKDYAENCYYMLMDEGFNPVVPMVNRAGERKTEAEAWADAPDFSADWNLIKPIAEKLRGEKWELKTNMSMDGYGATFVCDWYTGAISNLFFTSYADDLAHAVCLAALQAKGYKP
jgi:hypothetical protein